MMQQSMRSQTPGMTPVPNNQGMPGQPPRMGGGPQGNVSALVVFFVVAYLVYYISNLSKMALHNENCEKICFMF